MSRRHPPLTVPFATSVQVDAILWRWMYGHQAGSYGGKPYWFPCMWNRGERSRYWQPSGRYLPPGDPFSQDVDGGPPGTPAPLKDARGIPRPPDKEIREGTVSWRRCEMSAFGAVIGIATLQAGCAESSSGGEDGDPGYFAQTGTIRAYEVALNNPGARSNLVLVLPGDVKP